MDQQNVDIATERRRKRRRGIVALLGALSMLTIGAGSMSLAQFTDTTSTTWNFTAGTIDISTNPAVAFAAINPMMPGDVNTQKLVVTNAGTGDLRYAISVAHDGRPAETFPVDYTLGARRFQGYLSKLADGRIYVLPVFWHNETKRWLDWKEIAPVPDHPTQDLRQIWNITCVNCHATNLAKNFNPATRTYDTSIDDLWEALTDPERIPRWFLPVSGDLHEGGRYQLEGNAGGTITRCRPPDLLAVTWEYGGDVSWVTVRLTSVSDEACRLELEHMAHPDDRWDLYGPGATGVGWDLSLVGLARHLATGAGFKGRGEVRIWDASRWEKSP